MRFFFREDQVDIRQFIIREEKSHGNVPFRQCLGCLPCMIDTRIDFY